MKILIEEYVLRQALEFIDTLEFAESDNEQMAVMDALKSALDDAENVEPVAWVLINSDGECEQIDYCKESPLPGDDGFIPLYSAPTTHKCSESDCKCSELREAARAVVNAWFRGVYGITSEEIDRLRKAL